MIKYLNINCLITLLILNLLQKNGAYLIKIKDNFILQIRLWKKIQQKNEIFKFLFIYF